MPVDQSTVKYRPIKGFPGYRVGDDGSVWSRWTKTHVKNRAGYVARLTNK